MRRLMCGLMLMLLLSLPWGAALANQWGLAGGLLTITEGTTDYDEYTMGVCDQVTATNHPKDWAFFTMKNRYHNELVIAMDTGDKWEVSESSTCAVYQPGESAEDLKITQGTVRTAVWSYDLEEYKEEECITFTLDYGEEYFTFYRGLSADWYLYAGRVVRDGVACSIKLNEKNALTFSDGSESAVINWSGSLLENFNIRLIPRSVSEVRQYNACSAFLPEGGFSNMLGETSQATLAVFAVPEEGSYRAAKGKAAVSLADEWTLMESLGDWELVRYEVSHRTSRIGWIHRNANDRSASFEDVFAHVPAVLSKDSYITDDPLVSEYELAQLPAGTSVVCLRYDVYLNANYVYAETSIDGERVCGFVPVMALSAVDAPTEADVMSSMTGDWVFYAGGSFYADALRLNADGTGEKYDVVDYDADNPKNLDSDNLAYQNSFTWRVASVAPENGYTWDDAPYRIIFTNDDGRVYAYGLSLTTADAAEMMELYGYPTVSSVLPNELSLTNGESGGGFLRVN